MRVRTLTNSSNETPTCVTSLKRRSRKLSQQMLALLSAHSASKDEQEHLKSGQTEDQSWLSPMASRATLTTMGTMNGLNRLALDRNNSGDMVEYYAQSDGQRDPRSTGYPPQLHSGHRSRARRAGHTPQSSNESSKLYSREAPKQVGTSPTKPIGPRAPNQPASVRTIEGNSKRRPLGISTDAHDSRRVQLAEFTAECSPDSSSAALSLRNLAQSAPSTSRYPPESQLNSLPARGGHHHNTRPAIGAPQASQDNPMSSYPTSPASPITPASAPPYTTTIRTPQAPRSKSSADRGKSITRGLPASPPQPSPLHNRAMSSDSIVGGIGSHIEPGRMQAHAHGGTGGSLARPRTPRDIGSNIDGTAVRPDPADHNASGQSSGSDYSETGQYAMIDHPNAPPQQQQQQTSVAQEYRDHTSSDVGTDVDSRPVVNLNPVPRPHPPRVQTDYLQQQSQQPATTSKVPVRPEGGTTKANAKLSWQGADLRGSIADLWTSAVTAAEEDFRQQEQLQKLNGPLSATSTVSAPSQMGSSGAVTSEPSSTPGGSTPSVVPFSSGLSSRPGSRGRENQPQPQIPQMPAIHSNSSSSHGHSHGYHVPLSIPPVPTLHAGPLPSPPHHIAVKPTLPPPPRPARNVTYGPVSVVPSNPNASATVSASAHGSASSIALKRPLGSREPSPHKQRSHTPPSPARPPPPPLARSPSPSKSPPPPPPAKSVSPSPPLPPPPARSVPPIPAPRETSSQSPIKTTVPLPPLFTSSNSTNTSATANSKDTSSLSVFARSPAGPVKPPNPLPPAITSKPNPALATAVLVPSISVNPPVSLPDPTMKPRPRSPPPPPPSVKPLQLPMRNSNNNSPLPPQPTQLPSVPLPATGKENNRENVAPPHSRERPAPTRVGSDYSIVAVSVKSGTTEEGTADGHEESKHGKVEVEVEILQSVDKGEGHVESSESEYSGSESQCVSVPPRLITSTDKRSLGDLASVWTPGSESKVTSSTVAVAPIPSKLELGDTPADRSTGSLHTREAAESISPQLHQVVSVSVEKPEVATPTKVTSVIEELDATPTRGNLAGAGNLGNVGPPVPVPAPLPAPAPNFSTGMEEAAHRDGRFAVFQRPPTSQPLEEPKMGLRPISLGFMKDEDFIFHLSEAEPAPDLTFEVPKRVNHDHRDARPPLCAPPPRRSKSGKRPPTVVGSVRPGGHARRENMSSSESEYTSGSEYEKYTREHRPPPKEEKNTAVRSPDFFGNPFATPSSSSRPTTANTTTTESESAPGHGTLLGWVPLPRKRNIRAEREAYKRNTIVPNMVDGSGLGHGVQGYGEDADADEDDDEFELVTEHVRVLRKLVREKGSWPPAMGFRDVISESTTAARARGYAAKINELAQEDCGLKDWIEIWLKPKLFAGQLDIQPAGVSAHGRVASGASVFSDTTFPMRFDAFRAIDLTPGAGGGPTELGNGPPPLPYPSLAMKQLQHGNAHRVKSSVNASNNLLPIPKKSARILASITRKASMKSKATGDASGQENREKERVRRKLYRAPPSGSVSDIGHSSSKASLVPLAPSIIGGPRALPGKPKRASTVLVIGPPRLIHPPPPAQYPPKLSKRPSLDAFISAAASSSSTVAPHQLMSFQTNMIPPAPEGPRPVTRTPSFPGHSSSSSSLGRGNGLAPPDVIVNGGNGLSKLRQAVSYQPPKQPSDDGHFEKSLDKLCDFMPDVEREVLAGYLQQAGGQEMTAIGRIVDARKDGAIAWR